jgi:hypothetical protein
VLSLIVQTFLLQQDWPENTVRAFTLSPLPVNPLPIVTQVDPFHLATLFALPLIVKLPPAIMFPENTVNAFTSLFKPLPIACHVEPFHFATLFTFVPPALVNEPPAIRSVPETVSA